ncbi:gasdermin [Sphingomonas sp. RS6]
MADAFTKHLQQFGYNAIALPTARFSALSLVYELRGKRGWLNDFDALSEGATGQAPPVSPPSMEPDFSGKVVRSLDASGTLNVLGGLISALGGGTLGLSGGLQRASTVTFQYGDVTMVDVSPVRLDKFLRTAPAPAADELLGRYLDDNLWVATRVLRSRRFTIALQDSRGTSLGLDIPVIQNMIGAAVKVEHSVAIEGAISFTGTQDVSFAFQAYLVERKGAGMTLYPSRAGEVRTREFFFADEDIAEAKLLPPQPIDDGEGLLFDVDTMEGAEAR